MRSGFGLTFVKVKYSGSPVRNRNVALIGLVVLWLGFLSMSVAQTSHRHITPREADERVLTRVEPRYPLLAASARVQGDVILDVLIGKDGDVESVDVVQGHPLLAPAAVDAVSHWVFDPYRVAGKPVEVETRMAIHFALSDLRSQVPPTAPASSGAGKPIRIEGARIRGTLTYYFNSNYGSKPDTGSRVFLVAAKGTANLIPSEYALFEDASTTKFGGSRDEIAIVDMGSDHVIRVKTVARTIADGNGNFEIANVVPGDYTLILRSEHVKSSGYRDALGSVVTIPIQASSGETLDESHDFGIFTF